MCRKPIQHAKDTLQDHEQFTRFAKGLFKDKSKNVSFVTSEVDLQDQLQMLDVHQLRGHANVEVQEAKRANSAYNLERTTGARKGGKRLQQFLKTFSDFLGAYSGIIDLVRNAGQQYGEAAYQTLSILLVVRGPCIILL